jgi:glutathione S-transferase
VWQIAALTALVEEKLEPLLRVSQYGDEKNYMQNVRAAILRAVRFPLNLYVAWADKGRAQEQLIARDLAGVPFSEVAERARYLYKQLDGRLGDSSGPFFFGTRPSSFDACLFGHLADAMADVNFVVILPDYSHLMAFFRAMHERLFTDEAAAAVEGPRGQLLRRANYVNSRNAFNQLGGSILCSEAPFVPQEVVDRYFAEDVATGGHLPRPAKPAPPTNDEEDRRQRRQNVVWLSVVGSVVAVFMLLEGIVAVLAGQDEEEEEGGEEDDEGEA